MHACACAHEHRVKRKADDPRHELNLLPRTHGSRGSLQECPTRTRCILLHCPWLPSKRGNQFAQTSILTLRDSSTTIADVLESNGNARMQPPSVRNHDQSCLRRCLGPVSRITTAAIDIKPSRPIWHRLFLPTPASVFSDQHHQPPRCPYAAGSTTAGPGWDWGAHLWCSPGTQIETQARQHLTKCNFSDFCRL